MLNIDEDMIKILLKSDLRNIKTDASEHRDLEGDLKRGLIREIVLFGVLPCLIPMVILGSAKFGVLGGLVSFIIPAFVTWMLLMIRHYNESLLCGGFPHIYEPVQELYEEFLKCKIKELESATGGIYQFFSEETITKMASSERARIKRVVNSSRLQLPTENVGNYLWAYDFACNAALEADPLQRQKPSASAGKQHVPGVSLSKNPGQGKVDALK